MGLIHSPASIVTDGLALHLDAANPNGYQSGENYVTYSNYNPRTWSNVFPQNTTLVTGIDAPDGTNTAVRIICSDNTGGVPSTGYRASLLRVSFPDFVASGSDNYTVSFYIRLISGSSSSSGQLTCDLQDGGPGTNYLPSLIQNQWVRITSTAIPTAGTKNFFDLLSDNINNYTLDFWGLQIERGSTATTLTPTNGSIITRTFNDLIGTTNFTVSGATYDSASRSLVFTRTMPPTTPETGAFANVTTTGNLTAENYLLNDHTTEVWFKPNNRNPTGYGAAFDETVSNIIVFTGYHSGLYYSATQYTYSIWTGNYSNAVNYTLSFNNNTVASWTQLVAVRSGNTLRLYMNGVEQTSGTIITSTASGTTSDSNLSIARANISSQAYSWHADMNFASLRMYKRALSATEVAQNFAAYRRRFGL
jgi:hypothetical protein